MSRLIQQVIPFDGVAADELFETYADHKRHGAAVRAPATFVRKERGAFTVFGESAVRGTTLYIDEPHTIVQRWRAALWAVDDPDSILILQFSPTDTGSKIELLQSGVPERIVDEIDKGWHRMYWGPWKQYFIARDQ